jgi:hypothetical protein
MPRIIGMDFKSNNLVAVGGAVVLSLAALFGAIRSIPYADREQTAADMNEVRAGIKAQWTAFNDEKDKNAAAHIAMKKDSDEADREQTAKITELVDKYEALLADERQLKGEVLDMQRRGK